MGAGLHLRALGSHGGFSRGRHTAQGERLGESRHQKAPSLRFGAGQVQSHPHSCLVISFPARGLGLSNLRPSSLPSLHLFPNSSSSLPASINEPRHQKGSHSQPSGPKRWPHLCFSSLWAGPSPSPVLVLLALSPLRAPDSAPSMPLPQDLSQPFKCHPCGHGSWAPVHPEIQNCVRPATHSTPQRVNLLQPFFYFLKIKKKF